MSHLTRRLAALAAAGTVALTSGLAATPAAEAADPLQAPAGTTLDQLYNPPAAKVAGTPGTVVWWQAIPNGDLANLEVPFQDTPPEHKSFRIIYRSTAIDGTPNVESAAVYIPTTFGIAWRPWGGWKVAAWDHATTGVADVCAPSRVQAQLPDANGNLVDNPEYKDHQTTGNEIIGDLLAKNIVSVKVDYEGLGTPGKHPYIVAKSLGRSTIDAVKATRAFLAANYGSASTDWAVAGQSEGGIAALGTSSLAPTLAPELNLKGTLSAVPPVNNKGMVFELGIWSGVTNLTPMASMMLQGAAMDSPTLGSHLYTGNPQTDILSAEGNTRWQSLESLCLSNLAASNALGVNMSHLFTDAAGSYKSTLYAKLDESDPNNIQLGPEPIQFWAASLDLIALQSKIFEAAQHQKYDNGKDVTWKASPWAIHPNIVDNDKSGHDMADWIGARLGA